MPSARRTFPSIRCWVSAELRVTYPSIREARSSARCWSLSASDGRTRRLGAGTTRCLSAESVRWQVDPSSPRTWLPPSPVASEVLSRTPPRRARSLPTEDGPKVAPTKESKTPADRRRRTHRWPPPTRCVRPGGPIAWPIPTAYSEPLSRAGEDGAVRMLLNSSSPASGTGARSWRPAGSPARRSGHSRTRPARERPDRTPVDQSAADERDQGYSAATAAVMVLLGVRRGPCRQSCSSDRESAFGSAGVRVLVSGCADRRGASSAANGLSRLVGISAHGSYRWAIKSRRGDAVRTRRIGGSAAAAVRLCPDRTASNRSRRGGQAAVRPG